MKVIDYFNELRDLIEKHPECKNYIIITSADDEGNEYRKSNYGPNLAQVHNTNDYFLEMVGFLGDENIDAKDCNTVIIN